MNIEANDASHFREKLRMLRAQCGLDPNATVSEVEESYGHREELVLFTFYLFIWVTVIPKSVQCQNCNNEVKIE